MLRDQVESAAKFEVYDTDLTLRTTERENKVNITYKIGNDYFAFSKPLPSVVWFTLKLGQHNHA
jgi:hypothetical protein